MSNWSNPTTDEAFAQRISVAEKNSVLARLESDPSADLMDQVVAEVRDAIRAGGYPLGEAGTIPMGLKNDCYSIFIWRFVSSLGEDKKLQTEKREKAEIAAQDKLKRISEKKYPVEPPTESTVSTSGSWNSENKIIMRTHPIPPPATQFPATDPTQSPYANPDAPKDN